MLLDKSTKSETNPQYYILDKFEIIWYIRSIIDIGEIK